MLPPPLPFFLNHLRCSWLCGQPRRPPNLFVAARPALASLLRASLEQHDALFSLQALATFGTDIAIAFSGAEDVALIEYAHLTGRPYRVFRCGGLRRPRPVGWASCGGHLCLLWRGALPPASLSSSATFWALLRTLA